MTSPRKNVLLSWSSGKDSAWALHVLRQQADIEIVGLLTTSTKRSTGSPCTLCDGN